MLEYGNGDHGGSACGRSCPCHDDPVLRADDDALLRAGLGVVLDTAADVVVVAEAGDGSAVARCVAENLTSP